MRFFFEYVSCCMMLTPSHNDSMQELTSSAAPKAEETRSLVTPVSAKNSRRRKRVPTRGSSADWRPSLHAISEDNAVAATPEKMGKGQRPTPIAMPTRQASQRNVKQCGPSSVRVNAHTRSHDFSLDPLPFVVPAFSAAPFMF